MDHVLVRDLRVPVHVGVTEQERARTQVVVVNIDIGVDLGPAGASDDLADTIDYDGLVGSVAARLRSCEARLVERLACEIVELLSGWPGVRTIAVEIGKEPPPVAEDVGGIAVRVEKVIGK